MLSFNVNRNLCQTSKAIAPFQLFRTDMKSDMRAGDAILEVWSNVQRWIAHCAFFSRYLLGFVRIPLDYSCWSDDTGHTHSNKHLLLPHPGRAGLQLKKPCSKSGNGRRLQAFHVRAGQGHDSTRYMRHEQESCCSLLFPCPVLWVSGATQITAMTYRHRLSSTESSDSTIPGVTLRIQLR